MVAVGTGSHGKSIPAETYIAAAAVFLKEFLTKAERKGCLRTKLNNIAYVKNGLLGSIVTPN